MRYLPILAGCLLTSAATADERPILTVYTYESFVSEWGPGPTIENAFEAACACDLRLVAAGDGAALLSRVLIEGEGGEPDLVLGLDQNLVADAAASGLFADHGITLPQLALPVKWDDPVFVPYDWGHFAFVYDRTRVEMPPDSFEALANSDLRIAIQDPRSSTPGLGLVMWVKAVFGDRAPAIWTELSDNILTVTPGWTEAYGLFLDGEADMVLSYTTSPAYHLIAEGDDTKAAAIFSDGHYLQIEVAGILKSAEDPRLARRFMDFMLTDEFQSVIPTTNWMFPVVSIAGGLPVGFETLGAPEKPLMLSPDQARALRDAAVEEWRAALSK